MKTAFPLLALFVCLGLALAPARASVVAEPNNDGFLQLTGKTEDGHNLWIGIHLRGPNLEDLHEKHVQEEDQVGNDWWGGPHHMISTFEMRIGTAFVPLFRSAYADLGEVRWIELTPAKDGFSLTLHGGEGGQAYTAKLRFRHGQLTEREIRHNGMAIEERTEYFPLHKTEF